MFLRFVGQTEDFAWALSEHEHEDGDLRIVALDDQTWPAPLDELDGPPLVPLVDADWLSPFPDSRCLRRPLQLEAFAELLRAREQQLVPTGTGAAADAPAAGVPARPAAAPVAQRAEPAPPAAAPATPPARQRGGNAPVATPAAAAVRAVAAAAAVAGQGALSRLVRLPDAPATPAPAATTGAAKPVPAKGRATRGRPAADAARTGVPRSDPGPQTLPPEPLVIPPELVGVSFRLLRWPNALQMRGQPRLTRVLGFLAHRPMELEQLVVHSGLGVSNCMDLLHFLETQHLVLRSAAARLPATAAPAAASAGAQAAATPPARLAAGAGTAGAPPSPAAATQPGTPRQGSGARIVGVLSRLRLRLGL
ncbi:hypothetical protein [Aquabacterium sp. OR-4]|uniref:hypothetical protein n=1 Tax=Aquabacterium sp. OR-4 TaxID=2978127 RepID=UPI0028C5C464|nr:hypothetical protein [Aquabacterium sp. OR-4]MDT7836024.1 hypothetical protein [Aquabacterium sp. OR-4]